MDMAKLMKLDSIDEARKCVKYAKAMARIKDFTTATKKLEEAKKLIAKSKNIVSSSDDPPTRLSRILGWFTPIFTMLPSEEVTGAMYTGDTFVYTTTTYVDAMSKATTSAVKREIHEKLNLLDHRCDEYIRYYAQRARETAKKK